jgi:hypothetical protein
MNIKDIRKANLNALLVIEATRSGHRGAKKRLAEKAATSPAYISQLLSDETEASMGNDLTRRLEQAYHQENGQMDRIGELTTTLGAIDMSKTDNVPKWPFKASYSDFSALPIGLRFFLSDVISQVCSAWDEAEADALARGEPSEKAVRRVIEKTMNIDRFRWLLGSDPSPPSESE